jgi:hypothetical protein
MLQFRSARWCLLVSFLWHTTSLWAANWIVMEARGGGFKIGQKINAEQVIALKEGERLTLIGPDGSKMALRGPFDASVVSKSGASNDPKNALAALVANRAARTSTAGVIRASGQVETLPDPWLIDASRAGTRCIQQGASLVFWRPDASRHSRLTVSPADRSFKTEWDWPKGVDRLPVPVAARLQNQNLLRVELDGQEFAIGLVEIPSDIDNPLIWVAWMTEKSCLQQSDALLVQLQGDSE